MVPSSHPVAMEGNYLAQVFVFLLCLKNFDETAHFQAMMEHSPTTWPQIPVMQHVGFQPVVAAVDPGAAAAAGAPILLPGGELPVPLPRIRVVDLTRRPHPHPPGAVRHRRRRHPTFAAEHHRRPCPAPLNHDDGPQV